MEADKEEGRERLAHERKIVLTEQHLRVDNRPAESVL